MAVKTEIEELEAELARLENEQLSDLEANKSYEDSHKIYFFKPYVWMNRALDLIGRKNVVVMPAPNKIGKTTLSVCVIDSWMRGYEAWNEVGPDYPGAVMDIVNGKQRYFAPSSLGKNPPVKIRISAEDWFKHFGETIIPEMKKWFPRHDYESKQNSQGFPYKWTHKKTGSTLEMITNQSDPITWEGWIGDAWIPDEPPPKAMYETMSRAVFLSNGKVFMPSTPLKEAWILDELVLSGRRDIGVIDDLTILSNDDLYASDMRILDEMGLSKEMSKVFFDKLLFKNKKKRIFVEDQGSSAEKFLVENVDEKYIDDINKLKLLRFVKDTDPEIASTRFGGQFKSLVGRILKEFNKSVHFVSPFNVPTDWPVEVHVDIAMSKPQALSYHTVNKQNIHYVIKERYEHLSADGIADAIIRDRRANAWRIRDVFIDPLAKGDTAYMRNQMGSHIEDTYTKLERKLRSHNIRLWVGSKDKESGVRNVREALMGVNGMPTLFFFDNLNRHYKELNRWVYDKHGNFPKGEKDDFDDMMECLYRSFLTGLRYREIKRDNHNSVALSSTGDWLNEW